MLTDPLISIPVPVAATQTEVNAGVVTNKYVSPATVPGGGGGSAAWGNITGDLEDQADLFTTFQPLEDQRLSTSDSVTFDQVILNGGYALSSLFDGTGGSVNRAVVANAPGTDATNFFEAFYGWGTPTFDASNLFVGASPVSGLFDGTGGYVLTAESSVTASTAFHPFVDFTANDFFGVGAGWGTPNFDALYLFGSAPSLNAGSADQTSLVVGVTGGDSSMIQVDGIFYYPHVTAGVLTFTDTP